MKKYTKNFKQSILSKLQDIKKNSNKKQIRDEAQNKNLKAIKNNLMLDLCIFGYLDGIIACYYYLNIKTKEPISTTRTFWFALLEMIWCCSSKILALLVIKKYRQQVSKFV